jgi:hypothetical protein
MYKNYIKGYARMVVPMFEITKRDVVFQWNLDYHKVFEQLK